MTCQLAGQRNHTKGDTLTTKDRQGVIEPQETADIVYLYIGSDWVLHHIYHLL